MKVSLSNLGKVLYSSENARNWLYDAKVSENIFRKADEVTDIPKDFIDCLGEVSFYYEEKPYILEENGSAKRLFVYKDKLGKADDYFQVMASVV